MLVGYHSIMVSIPILYGYHVQNLQGMEALNVYIVKLDSRISICKYESFKCYIWISVIYIIKANYIVGFYISHKLSNLFEKQALDNLDPFADLYKDAIIFGHKGVILVVGDSNA